MKEQNPSGLCIEKALKKPCRDTQGRLTPLRNTRLCIEKALKNHWKDPQEEAYAPAQHPSVHRKSVEESLERPSREEEAYAPAQHPSVHRKSVEESLERHSGKEEAYAAAQDPSGLCLEKTMIKRCRDPQGKDKEKDPLPARQARGLRPRL